MWALIALVAGPLTGFAQGEAEDDSLAQAALAASEAARSHTQRGQWKDALQMERLHISLRDSLRRVSGRREALKHQLRFEYEKREALLAAEQEKRDALAAERLKRRGQQRNALQAGLALAAGLAAVSFASYRRKRRDHAIITEEKRKAEEKKDEVEQKNREIMESIAYARRLQEAVLPPPRVVQGFFDDSFLLYLPRDIVSGDFYWMESRDGNSYFAVGDCTGHGVPGAMLSVMGLNALNRGLNELGIQQPDRLLTHLHSEFLHAFERSDDHVHDGMDIAICALDAASGKLLYAGANIPLWVCRDGQMLITPADRKAIGGGHPAASGFTLHSLDLCDNDIIYLSSDGYPDQHGGQHGRKMMRRSFREMLLSVSPEPLVAQARILREHFDRWRGMAEQTDDVCVIGIRWKPHQRA